MLICTVVGVRADFMKMAPIVHELQRRKIPQILVHAEDNAHRSRVFFEQLKLPQPDFALGVSDDSQARQTANVMIAFEEICQQHQPDLVLVSGDVNSTLAAALSAVKLNIPLAHVEAGLRSFDRTMPEEVNRVLTDHIADLLFTSEPAGEDNLRQEGINGDKIHFVGNCMVDTLLTHVETAIAQTPWELYDLTPGSYAVLTLHRPSNVDERETFTELMATINEVSRLMPIVFPVHPRTRRHLAEWKITTPKSVLLVEPLPYLPFLGLIAKAGCVLTDSLGIQQETTVLNVPCLTLCLTTEMPVTVTSGTNRLVGTDPQKIEESVQMIMTGTWKVGDRPPLWDGLAGNRITNVIVDWAAEHD
jgi:UDP-N-acetylglucosamine 2-epimerase (non-hydrolysing)